MTMTRFRIAAGVWLVVMFAAGVLWGKPWLSWPLYTKFLVVVPSVALFAWLSWQATKVQSAIRMLRRWGDDE